jgi:hypothetical protein
MEHSPWEANSHSTSQEISLLWIPMVYYRVDSWQKPATGLYTEPDASSLILSSDLRLRIPRGVFQSGFPTKMLYAFLLWG